MAKLFGKDYHEKSNTWFFNHVIIALEKDDLLYWKSIDEQNNIHIHFFPAPSKSELFCRALDVVYDPVSQTILQHHCSECAKDDNCRHYLSLLRYAYTYLNTDIFSTDIVETCFGNVLRTSEAHLLDLPRRKIEVEGIYNPSMDKIRFYFPGFEAIDIMQLFLYHKHGATVIADEKSRSEIAAFALSVSDSQMLMLDFLAENKSSFSPKGRFFSIYKTDFPKALALMKNCDIPFVIRESGEALEFVNHPLAFSLRLEMYGEGNYLLNPILVDEISVWYPGNPTWIFLRNQVRTLKLPFTDEVINRIFERKQVLSEKDLIYFRALVHKQLHAQGIYLDFDERIQMPHIVSDAPKIHLLIKEQDGAIVLEGYLKYLKDIDIPLSVVRFGSPLIKTKYISPEIEHEEAWFYLPPEVFVQTKRLVKALPNADLHRLEEHSQLVFGDVSAKEQLKQAVFELSENDWDIDISPALRQDFVYKVALQIEISARSSEEIDWFSYELRYRYKDFCFTHEELKKYFVSEQKFLHTTDGRIVFITNPEIIHEAERLLQKSEKQLDNVYRARLQNLPYYLQLQESNPAFGLQADDQLNRMFRDIQARKCEKQVNLPHYLQAIMRSYQKAGFAWLKMLEKYRLNGILADEMGLGKTLQALSLVVESPIDSVSMVICPKTLLYNWAAEIEKFHTNIPYAIVEGDRKTRRAMLHSPNICLYIVSYSIVTNDIDEFCKLDYNWVILDEAQNIKNVGTLRSAAIKKLKAKHKLALSGTPIENKPSEIWSIFDFLMPGYLGTLGRFKKEFSSEKEDSAQRLHRYVSPFLLRRTKNEVLLELPDKQEQISWCKLSPVQEKLYLQIVEQVKKQLFSPNRENPNYIHVLSALTKLRQICNHPTLISPDIKNEAEISTKLEMLMELVNEAIQNGHKILIFSQFVQMLSIIRKAMDAANLEYAYMDGQSKDRISPVNRFNQDANLKLFLISLKTGGVGLNLTAADTVILFDPWWNPMIENQAIDRTHRIGQTRKVQVIRLITKGTVEEKILALQQSKRELFDAVVEDGQKMLQSISIEEMKSLFQYS